MQLSFATSAQSSKITMHNPEGLAFEYVATGVAPIIGSWLLASSKILATLWMCNWMVYNIFIELLWSLETRPLFTLHIAWYMDRVYDPFMVLSEPRDHEKFWNPAFGPWLRFVVRFTIHALPDRIAKLASDASDLAYPLN